MSPNIAEITNAVDEVWITYDANNSGVLEAGEFKRFLNQTFNVLGFEASESAANRVLEKFANGKGHLNKDDMIKLLATAFN